MKDTPPNPLACWMQKHGHLGRDVAVWLDISPALLSRLLRGERQADPDTLARIVTVTGGDVSPNSWVSWAAMLTKSRGDRRKK